MSVAAVTPVPEPPHDAEVERALLGALLHGALVPEHLTRGDFYLGQHRAIFQACLSLREDGQVPDLVTVTRRLREMGKLVKVGGASYVSELAESLPDMANVEHYARLIQEDAARRAVIHIGRDLQHLDWRPIRESTEKAVTELNSIASRLAGSAGRDGFSYQPITVDELLMMDLPDRENLLGGWLHYQDLAMVHAWRGVGKTYFALGIAVAVAAGKPFLSWEAGESPAGVLYVDGEMPAKAMQGRLKTAVCAVGLPKAPLKLVTPDLQPHGMRTLNDLVSQMAIERTLDSDNDIKLVILDNLSALCGGPENDAESWQAMQEFCLKLRRRGLAALIVHHSGKGGAQRGTSRREDILDAVVHLILPNDHDQSEGARFEVKFEKSRGVFGDAVKSIEASLIEDENGKPTWAVKSLEDSRAEQVARLKREGLSQKEIAAELRIHKSNVSRALKRAKKRGILIEEDEDVN